MKRVDVPPVSPFGLIQETLWPDGWAILVVSMLLNCTSRKQVEKVWPSFTGTCPSPQALLSTEPDVVKEIIRSLGFKDRRTKNLYAMTHAYLNGGWTDPRELPGIGEYGARSYEIFVWGLYGTEPPKDHALDKYWRWCKHHGFDDRL